MNQYTDTSYPTESFSYDRDGNMTADGTYAYTWDGENRLIGVAPASLPGNGDKKLEFKYDYMGRRVEKIYSLHNGSTWVEQTHERFVYDQWNVIMVLNGNSEPVNQTLRKYTWGLDMSGLAGGGVAPCASPVVSGIHGAGGIGGLIASEEMSGTLQGSYWYLYDGNGNVGQILKYEADSPPTISTAAYYEYDPYGNIIGPDTDNDGDWQDDATEYAKANPIRFSTKWFDESGLGYWGYRYYSPRLGRWMSRDPIGEEGGINVYASFHNSTFQYVDPDGRASITWPTHTLSYSLAVARCMYCAAFYDPRQEANDLVTDWLSSPCRDSDLCKADAMQHCIGGSIFSAVCGRKCTLLAGYIQELAEGEWDQMDLANNEAGATKCAASGQEAINCCARLLNNGELDTTNGKCQ